MKAIFCLIFLSFTISVPMRYPEECKISLTDRIHILTILSPGLQGQTLTNCATSFPGTTSASVPSLSEPGSLPATTANLTEPGLPSSSLIGTIAASTSMLHSSTIPDTISTRSKSFPDQGTSTYPSESGSGPAPYSTPDTITPIGVRDTLGTLRKKSSITLYYLLRSDYQQHPSGPDSSNINVEKESDESLNTGSISTGDTPDDYNLQPSDTLYTWVKEATRIYSPDSWHLLMQYDNLPRVSEARHTGNMILSMPKLTGTFEYLEGNNKTGMISSMSANIHEISHGYYSTMVIRHAADNNFVLDSDNVTGLIFISPNESYYIEFPKSSLFPSKELATRIPRKFRTSKFNTYITGKTLTQSQGVFGLLDELHAFYLGSKFSFEILEGYKIAEGSAAEGFYQWVSNSRSSMTALFEFDFFILEYLLYMKSHYPQNYASLKSYQPFHDAYAAVRMKYSDLLLSYLDKIQEEVQVINSSGTASFIIEGNILWMKRPGSSRHTGTSFISKDMHTLLPILKSTRYSEVEKDFPVVFPERNIYSKF